jgi:tellurite resistance protein TerC
MLSYQTIYEVFGVVIILGLLFDLGFFSKKNTIISFQKALLQTAFWVFIAIGFFVFLLYFSDSKKAFEYLSAYLMEWSLSVDNIFVFILIFTSFQVKEIYYGRVLLIGIIIAILFRLLFITIGVALVNEFTWVLYIFGFFLLYTGIKMFSAKDEAVFSPKDSKAYLFLKKILPIAHHDGGGKYLIRENGKPIYTILFVVVVLLGVVDFVFALDSIPAVMGVSKDRLVIYSSNIFAVLGLRSLFFLLRGAVTKFDYLQQGIAIILIFIGAKMLLEHWIAPWVSTNAQTYISLIVILGCIAGSILYSIRYKRKGIPKEKR